MRITKIKKKNRIQNEHHENHAILQFHRRFFENHKSLAISCENYENYENPRIPHENCENTLEHKILCEENNEN